MPGQPQTHLALVDIIRMIYRQKDLDLSRAVLFDRVIFGIDDLLAVDPPVDLKIRSRVEVAVEIIGDPDAVRIDIVSDSIKVSGLLAVEHPDAELIGI